MIARERRLPSWLRRAVFVIAVLVLIYVVLIPLTSTDAAQSAGLPLLADKLWFAV